MNFKIEGRLRVADTFYANKPHLRFFKRQFFKIFLKYLSTRKIKEISPRRFFNLFFDIIFKK